MTLLMAEYSIKNNRQLHAASHGGDFYDPDLKHVENIIGKIEVEIMEGKANDGYTQTVEEKTE